VFVGHAAHDASANAASAAAEFRKGDDDGGTFCNGHIADAANAARGEVSASHGDWACHRWFDWQNHDFVFKRPAKESSRLTTVHPCVHKNPSHDHFCHLASWPDGLRKYRIRRVKGLS
jgi:hypothetical protein